MNKYIKKAMEKAYDSIYDLNSVTKYVFDTEINTLSKALKVRAESIGYEFRLNKADKFKLYVKKVV